MKIIYKQIFITLSILILFISNGLACSVSLAHSPSEETEGLVHFEAIGVYGEAPFVYSWSIDNLFSCGGPSVDYVFESSGTYEICLDMTDGNSCQTSVCQEIEIELSTCPDFEIETGIDNFGNMYGLVVNTENIYISPTSIDWYFQNPYNSIGNESHFYLSPAPAPGYYTVCADYEYSYEYEEPCLGTICKEVQILSNQDNCETTVCVLPGDTNGDQLANIYDIFPIGIYYGLYGPVRPDASCEWLGQVAQDWSMTDINGINLKHIDCNGDGTIDEIDVTTILGNYQNDYDIEIPEYGSDSDPSIYLEYNSDSIVIDEDNPELVSFSVDLILGSEDSPVTDLYGLATVLEFDKELVVHESVTIEYVQNSFYSGEDEIIHLAKQTARGNFDIGSARRTSTSASGSGKIATVNFTIIGDLVAQRSGTADQLVFPIELTNTKGIRSNGSRLGLNQENFEITLHIDRHSGTDNLKLEQQIEISPNPSTGIINLNTNGYELEEVNIISAQGQKVRSINIDGYMNNGGRIDLSDLSNGVYFIEMNHKGDTITKKIVISK